MRKIAALIAGLSVVYFIMPAFIAMFLLLQLRGSIDLMPPMALAASTVSMLSAGLLAKASKPGSAARLVSALICIDLALLAITTLLAIYDDKSFFSDPVSLAESAWMALLMALTPMFTALALSLPGTRGLVRNAVVAVSALVSAFAIFSAIMVFRDLIQTPTIHAMLLLIAAYLVLGMPTVGVCALSMALLYGKNAKISLL